jgi:hypothetical protein
VLHFDIVVQYLDELVYMSCSKICPYSKSPHRKEKYIIGYIAGGFYKVLIEWVKNGLKERDEEMAEIIIGLTQK